MSNLCGAGIEVEVFPRETQDLAHSPALAEQQSDRRTESQFLGRGDQRLGVGGGEGPTCLHSFRAWRLDEVELVGRDQTRT